MNPKNTRLVALLASCCLFLITGSTIASSGQPGPSHCRVVWGEDPAHVAKISWSTQAAGSKHEVLLATSPQAGDLSGYSMRVTSHRDGEFTRDSRDKDSTSPAWYHHAEVRDLAPSTTYWFVIVSDQVPSREFHFMTGPVDNRPFKIIYGGDSRSGHPARQEMNRFMASIALEDPDVLAFAHGGDYIMSGALWSHWKAWLDHHELSVAASGRVLPIIPVRGNHDTGPLYDEVFDRPGEAGKNYYTTQLGSQVALITLNSEISTTGDQALWLEEQLAELRPANRWLLAQYHRPLFPAVKSPGAAKSTWVPLFEHFDVDLVLESDGHVIKRTVPIRDGKHDPSGVTYIGEGGLGVPQRTPDTKRWYLKEPGMAASAHHVSILEFSDEGLQILTVGPPTSEGRFEPKEFTEVIAPQADWSYLVGEDPSPQWSARSFDSSAWPKGSAGFGYGDDDDSTLLDDMRGEYSRVYLRKSIDADSLEGIEELALMIRYDDAFIAYANGKEFSRVGVKSGAGALAKDIQSHEARDRFDYIPIPDWRAGLEGGELVLAIEGHNASASSSDFTLDLFLIADPSNTGKSEGAAGRIVHDDHRLEPRTP